MRILALLILSIILNFSCTSKSPTLPIVPKLPDGPVPKDMVKIELQWDDTYFGYIRVVDISEPDKNMQNAYFNKYEKNTDGVEFAPDDYFLGSLHIQFVNDYTLSVDSLPTTKLNFMILEDKGYYLKHDQILNINPVYDEVKYNIYNDKNFVLTEKGKWEEFKGNWVRTNSFSVSDLKNLKKFASLNQSLGKHTM